MFPVSLGISQPLLLILAGGAVCAVALLTAMRALDSRTKGADSRRSTRVAVGGRVCCTDR